MSFRLGDFLLRSPEPDDVELLYQQKNDPEIQQLLVGFSPGRSRQDIRDWIEYHRTRKDEVVWVVAEAESNRCVGHLGLYQIDQRVRSADLGIMLGDKSVWGRGLGRACCRFALDFAFQHLNLNRVELRVLASNERALGLYRSLGFQEEGRLRQAHYVNGRYLDVLVMSILRSECLGDG